LAAAISSGFRSVDVSPMFLASFWTPSPGGRSCD